MHVGEVGNQGTVECVLRTLVRVISNSLIIQVRIKLKLRFFSFCRVVTFEYYDVTFKYYDVSFDYYDVTFDYYDAQVRFTQSHRSPSSVFARTVGITPPPTHTHTHTHPCRPTRPSGTVKLIRRGTGS